MFTKEQLENIFNQEIKNFHGDGFDIVFDIDLSLLNSNFNTENKSEYFTFILGNNGLLTLSLDIKSLEYHMKINNLDDLKYAINHIDEWEDDWNV